MTVSELKHQLKAAQLIEQQQANMPSDQYVAKLHYMAVDVVSRLKLQLMNHPEVTMDEWDELFGDVYELPYPVSC